MHIKKKNFEIQKLAAAPTLPTLCVCKKKLELSVEMFFVEGNLCGLFLSEIQ